MAEDTDSLSVVPTDIANVPPRDLYPTSDIRFVMIEIGKLSAKVDALRDDSSLASTKLAAVETAIDRARHGAFVMIAILTIVGGIFWWMVGDKITAAKDNMLSNPVVGSDTKK